MAFGNFVYKVFCSLAGINTIQYNTNALLALNILQCFSPKMT